jgi:oligoribonuclease
MTKIDKLLWVDIEYTNKDVDLGQVIEIAAIVTKGPKFKEVDRLNIFVELDEAELDQMKHTPLVDWSSGQAVDSGRTIYDMHEANGLIEKVKRHGLPKDEAEAKLVKFIRKNFDEGAYLVGNSIRFDRAFFSAQWPEVEKLLHYRMIDVTAFKLMLRLQGIRAYKKNKTHLALDDIQESIEEMRYYMTKFSV